MVVFVVFINQARTSSILCLIYFLGLSLDLRGVYCVVLFGVRLNYLTNPYKI